MILLFVLTTLSAQSDSLRFFNLLVPSDTLDFSDIYLGIYGNTPEVIKNRQLNSRKLEKDFMLMDSIPEYHLYLYSRGNGNISGAREFRLSYQRGDTALVSGFETALPASLGNLEVVAEGEKPVIQLDYVEYESSNSGSTEMEVAAYFMLDGFCLPLTRVIRKLWLSENGNYEPECKDYQYFSVEFSRNVRFRNSHLELGSGNYKFSENLNCEVSNSYQKTPAGSYTIRDYLVLKR
jgi:hypothetical protein